MNLNFSTILAALRKQDLLDTIDLRLIGQLVAQDMPDASAFVAVTSALCKACAEGSLCIPLEQKGLGVILSNLLSAAKIDVDEPGTETFAISLAVRFLENAEAGRYASTLGTPEKPRPLIRANGYLYLHRYYYAERAIADGLATRMGSTVQRPTENDLVTILKQTLDERPLRAPDGSALELTARQQEALTTALREPVFVLSGGPGTGKTTWTAAWLRAVLRLPGTSAERVRLCAPTGRAARRLEESLRARLDGSGSDPVDASAHEVQVTTLHSLLGYRAFEGRFARGPEDPIDADWILLDEASMADVFLLATLVRALRPGARLVLAGDPDQLPAVEAGSVLAELLNSPIPSVTLDTGHRAHGTVAALTRAVRSGDPDAVVKVLGPPLLAERLFTPATPVARVEPEKDESATLAKVLRAYAHFVFEAKYESLLTRFRTLNIENESATLVALETLDALWTQVGQARVLAPLRRGPVSAESANRLLRNHLEPLWRRPGDTRGEGFHGAPILITRNDDRAGLSNGDVGLWLQTGEDATVFFPRPDLKERWLQLPATLLPPHELGFASTVHKSQGSEYEAVLLLLPEAGNRLLARETLYTAITRARGSVHVLGTEAAIREATEHRLQRFSGLRSWFKP